MPNNKNDIKFLISLKYFYHKYGLGHVILLLSYVVFLLCFATSFYYIENKHSTSYYQQWQQQIEFHRNKFITNDLIPNIFNNTKFFVFIHNHKSQYLTKLLNRKLVFYEKKLKLKPPMPILQCTFFNSILYAFSSITTIGYGYIYPITRAGKIISMIFSIFGIPFTIIVIKDVEYLLVKLLSYPCLIFVQIWHMFRFCTLRGVSETETEGKLDQNQLKYNKCDYRISTVERLLLIPITIVIFAVIGWITLGCLLGNFYNVNIDGHILLFFIFNTLSTIGIGGIDIGEHPLVLIVLIIYTLCGLSIISLFINLLHTKFNKNYRFCSKAYMPLNQHISTQKICPIESFDDGLQNYTVESSIHQYTTLGIFQPEDRCPLIEKIKNDKAVVDAVTQTQPIKTEDFQNTSNSIKNPPNIPTINETKSHDDVNSLIIETYGGTPEEFKRKPYSFMKKK